MVNFYVGQKVACIDASHSENGTLHGLTEGKIYTIRDVGLTPNEYLEATGLNQSIVIKLYEIIRPSTWYLNGRIGHEEIGYCASRFRPLIETDISIFIAMLTPTPEHVRQFEEA